MADISHILFPSDVPKPIQVPEYIKAEHASAQMRLAGQHGTTTQGAATETQAERADPSAGKDAMAETMFAKDVPAPEKDISDALASRMEGYELDARLSGEADRGDELASAMSSLTADFHKHGTSVSDVREMMELLHDGKARLMPPTPEEASAGYADGMERLISEYGDESALTADLARARRFVADLATVSPGVVETLNASGMGNDTRMIRLAIREARRRGY